MPNMTLRRLAPIVARVQGADASPQDVGTFLGAVMQRKSERSSSKLARRLRRKIQLGRAGAF